MTNLTRYDPFDMTRSADPFELVERFVPTFFQPMIRSGGGQTWGGMKLDLYDTGNAYELTAEVPGLRKEDIDVTIYGNEVTINAEAKEEKEAGGGEAKALHTERWRGKLTRNIRLPMDVDEEGAQASFTDGLLRLTLPKKASSQAKHLQIH